MQIHLIDTTSLGYIPITDYGLKLSIADAYGIEEVKKDYEPIAKEARKDYKKLTELSLILALKMKEHFDHKEYLDFYTDKYIEISRYGFDTLEGEELKYFVETMRKV